MVDNCQIYLEMDYDGARPDYGVILSFTQVADGVVDKHSISVSWRDLYLSHYDPTILAVCVIYDLDLWATHGICRIIDVGRCTSNYTQASGEIIDVVGLSSLFLGHTVLAGF